ncbi:DUF4174 domain-containing protein [Parvularcula mediterranea]|uniref:DUF4174 domain-containing protein n=1 Tax=Parvularcula mediterranea TaxID=2732508 RepID=UPI001564129C
MLTALLASLSLAAAQPPALGGVERTPDPVVSAPVGPLLDQLQWKRRILIVHNDFVRDQIGTTEKNAAFAEREIVVVNFGARGVGITLFDEGGQNVRGRALKAPGALEDLFQRYGVAPGKPEIVLVGKDGQIKGRWEESVELETLTTLIDSMPMRQQEMDNR